MEQKRYLNNLQILCQQTAFLLDKQRESKKVCVEEFSALIALVAKDIEDAKNRGDIQKENDLKKVLDIVTAQRASFEESVNDDITYLEEQCAGISQACNEARSENEHKELYEALMGDEELVAMDEFKRSVLEETATSQNSFKAVINDLRIVLAEGGIDELLAYLESMESGEESCEDDEECCEDEEGECCEDEDECCEDDKRSSSSSSENNNGKPQGECCKGRNSCGSSCVCNEKCGC